MSDQHSSKKGCESQEDENIRLKRKPEQLAGDAAKKAKLEAARKRKTSDEAEALPSKKPAKEVSRKRKSDAEEGPEAKMDKAGGSLSLKALFAQQRSELCKSPADFKFNKKRVHMVSKCNEFPDNMKGIMYWMSRDNRVQDNWSFIYAQRMALKYEVPLHVCFCVLREFPHANLRHCDFMLGGLQEVWHECRDLDIPFHLFLGEPADQIPSFVDKYGIGGIVCDYSPLRECVKRVNDLQTSLEDKLPLCLVDAHNIVPVWEASPKQEYGARTIRRKITDQLPAFLTGFPPVISHPYKSKDMFACPDFDEARAFINMDETVAPVTWAKPGYSQALLMVDSFCKSRLSHFAAKRNDPTVNACSNLSPWFHHGHLSVQRAILHVKQGKKYSESVAGFVEEAVIRRELSDNFCHYNEHYDQVKGAADWAQKTLNDHRKDKRVYVYSLEQLEHAKTHDPLWNAAERQLTREGKMHGFLRMYWAKKILEWTSSPEEALKHALYLNDRYSLDGNDPNGFVGCMWSICGIHDQGWPERQVFGKVRFMNFDGCKRKFDVNAFINRYRA